MKNYFKGCLAAGAIITGGIVISGIYIVNEIGNGLLLDQSLNERFGLLRCFQKLRTNELTDSSECEKYAQVHPPLYPEFNAEKPEESLCLVSKDIFKNTESGLPFKYCRDKNCRGEGWA